MTVGPFTNRVTVWRLVIFNEAAPVQGILAQFNVVLAQDSDGDGIPDSFETSFGLDPFSNADRDLDADGDGASNWAEFVAGTDPTNPASNLELSTHLIGGTATVSFLAPSNHTYSVQFSEQLGGNSWTKLADVFAAPASRPISVSDPNFRTNRFYRVVSPQQP